MSQDKDMASAGELVQIRSGTQHQANSGADLSRRKFLKILGAGSAAGLAACADNAKQNVFPNLKGDQQQIPGVAVWYNSTCSECSAGCGISVRTREGRAVKIEGNGKNPINRGGLCALGQSSLQALYDPDRIRQPLKRTSIQLGKPIFSPISWDEALSQTATWLKEGKKKHLITGNISGALDELLEEFSTKNGVKRTSYDLLEAASVANASELVFGKAVIPKYRFDKAETVVNFGADFLETWISPCEYARDWSIGIKKHKPLRLVHIEPRLSLTGANADLWLAAKPGSEVRFALALLKIISERGRDASLKEDQRAKLKSLLASVSVTGVAEETGIAADKIAIVAEYLAESNSSLVVAGGTAASTDQQLGLLVACNLLNLVLGNVGRTVDISSGRRVNSSVSKLVATIEALNAGDVDLLLLGNVNPAFTLPGAYGFDVAAKKAANIVSFATHLDETAMLADIILPSHHFLEDWGDVRNVPGVNSLIQPAMLPVFDTRSFGDMIIGISEKAGQKVTISSGSDFQSYLKDSWKKLHSALGAVVSADFARFWKESLEAGGHFTSVAENTPFTPQTSPKALEFSFEVASFEHKNCSESDPVLYPYPSVRSFDGRAANRPWLQELADPITQNVWDDWVELHPDTAKKYQLAAGDLVTLRNYFGEITAAVYISEWVVPGIAAVPMGQGHSAYGRYASQVGHGNVLGLLPAVSVSSTAGDGVPLLVTRTSVQRARGRAKLVNVQGSNSQMGRDLAQRTLISGAALAAHNGHDSGAHGNAEHGNGHGAGSSHGHHAPKQMYNQRTHPLHSWGLAVDLAACTGCSACVVACYAENNISVVGKTRAGEGREMAWLRIERYFDNPAEEMRVSFLPMMCQQCGNAPCEPVCPVYATYHNEEGLNAMIYNRCVGTRYCSNNCSYKVRRFNWFEYETPFPLNMQFNPDVTQRSAGVMEKCTFCVQRILEAKDKAKDLGRTVADGEIQPACVQSCPTQALTFGDRNNKDSKVSKLAHSDRAYKILDHHLNTQPAVTYLKDVKYKV